MASILDRFRPKQDRVSSEVDLRDLFETHDFHGVTDSGVLLMTKRPTRITMSANDNLTGYRQEIGVAGFGYSIWNNIIRGDYNPELFGIQGLKKFDEMRRSDAQVRSALRLIKTPVLGARWYVEPASDRKKDKTIAEFVWKNLNKWMSISFSQVLLESLLMLDFGYYLFEKVYDWKEVNGQRRIIFKKLAPRHPMDVIEWHFDPEGGPKSIDMFHPTRADQQVNIPIEKLAVFTFDKEAGNVTGISALRSAYKHWFYKEQLYKIDAIQKERHGIGIPIITLPPNFDDDDRRKADEIGRNLRTNEKAHVVLPPNWQIIFAKLEGQLVNALDSAEHHGRMIFTNVLGEFLSLTTATDAQTSSDIFAKATRYIAEIIRDVFNKYCIPQLVDFNWSNIEDYPELRVRRIGDTTDWRTLSFAIRNFIGAQAMFPDDPLEAWIRDEMDLPRADPETKRKAPTPQMPGAAGPPRQAPANKMTRAQSAGKTNVGSDKSGGK